MKGYRTPKAIEQQICLAYQAGDSWRTIAENFGMSPTTVQAVLARNGIKTRNNSQSWSQADDEFLAEHYNIDRTADEIGIALGRGKNSIIGRANRLGLSKPLNPNSEATGRDSKLTQEMRT